MQATDDSKQTALNALTDVFRAEGYPCEELDTYCYFAPLNLKTGVLEVTEKTADDRIIASVTYETTGSPGLPRPFRIICTGTGDDIFTAAKQAAVQWLHVAFPPLHSLLSQHEDKLGVTVAKLATQNVGSGQYFGWLLHVGPVFTIAIGDATDIEPSDSTELIKALTNHISAISVHEDFFWLDLYAGRAHDGRVLVDCRINNQSWPAGDEAVETAAKSWPTTNAKYLSKRQVILFQPTDPSDEPQLQARLREFAKEQHQPHWWQRLFGKS